MSLDSAAPMQGPPRAEASVSIALSLDELLEASELAVVAVATERRSRWEKVGSSKRIVTYTKIEVTRSAWGTASSPLWVRTLGGVVGKIGQYVSGEARIALGSSSLLFLRRSADEPWVVTGRAQGHYPVVKPESGPPRLQLSPDRGQVRSRRGPSVPASARLDGRTLDEGIAAIEEAGKRLREKERLREQQDD